MIDLLQVAGDVQAFCDSQGWRSCIIGGIALQRWGETRVTRDVDLTLLTGFDQEGPFVEALLAQYTARITDAALFAHRSRVLLLQSQEGIGIDVSLGALPYEELVVSRATDFSFGPGLSLRTCSAEDLLVMKLFAFRPLDLRDAESIALRNHRQLDWVYVERHLRPLAELKEEPGIMRELARLKDVPAYPPE